MENLFRISLFLVGIINILPSVIAFLPHKISTAYGIEIPNANYELLLRHRAVLFGIIGGMLIYAALTKRSYDLAVFIGLISMVSFVILAKVGSGTINLALTKVMNIDLIGIVILLIGYVLYKFK
ncbi:MAG: hypothetical protein AB8G15_09220 [Saprospiraceae bacterium]